jgi:ketosteroid isomerase-like protein
MKKAINLLKQLTVVLAASGLFLGFQGCNDTSKEKETMVAAFDLSSAKAEIEEANKDFMKLLANGDTVGLANFYTIDAKFMGGGAPSVVGRANIQNVISEYIKAGITVDLRLENVYGTEELIAEEGELTVFINGEEVSVEKYIVLWKKEDGRWKLFRDIFNPNSPAE